MEHIYAPNWKTKKQREAKAKRKAEHVSHRAWSVDLTLDQVLDYLVIWLTCFTALHLLYIWIG